ncbi:MAG: peptide deformylase [Acidobacteria bacterium]|nr:peptide deformylase [Acidobacteriota bacterium]
MAVLDVLRMGHPLLRQRARKVSDSEIHSPEMKKLIEDMVDTMHAHDGVGLAAPQVGASIRMAIIELDPENDRYTYGGETRLGVYFNPEIEVLDETPQSFWEGCLSVPGLRGRVTRPRQVRVHYTNLEGERCVLEAEDFLATVFQHEFDHLDGVLYVDRLEDTHQLTYLDEFHQFWLGDEADVEV